MELWITKSLLAENETDAEENGTIGWHRQRPSTWFRVSISDQRVNWCEQNVIECLRWPICAKFEIRVSSVCVCRRRCHLHFLLRFSQLIATTTRMSDLVAMARPVWIKVLETMIVVRWPLHDQCVHHFIYESRVLNHVHFQWNTHFGASCLSSIAIVTVCCGCGHYSCCCSLLYCNRGCDVKNAMNNNRMQFSSWQTILIVCCSCSQSIVRNVCALHHTHLRPHWTSHKIDDDFCC